jgi:hypothetical protein
MLQPLIQQLAAQDPRLAQAIAQNPEMLFQILGGALEGEGEEGEGGIPPGATVIELTQAEREAVERVRVSYSTPVDDMFADGAVSWRLLASIARQYCRPTSHVIRMRS